MITPKTADVSINDLRALARTLHCDPLHDGALMSGPGHGPSDRSLRIWFDPLAPEGFRVHSFAGDDPISCRDHVRAKLGFPDWRPNIYGLQRAGQRADIEVDARRRQRNKARWLWNQSQDGQIVRRYLRARGIKLPRLPPSLRLLPARPPRYQNPAMIAPFAIPHEPTPGHLEISTSHVTGVHLTLLRPDGSGKAGTARDKIMIGPSMGTPIVLAPINDNLGLAITEGIEDALSVHVATELGIWAAGSATRMPALADAVPDYVDAVTVVADADEVGQYNAHALAERLAIRGIYADVTTPVSGLGLAV
jgi:Toprim domain